MTSGVIPEREVESTPPRKIIVIGAGVVGMSSALFLQRDGHHVTVIDPREPGTATSFGNAGGVVSTGNCPVFTSQMVRRIPKMLLDPLDALTIRWGYLPQLTPWLLRLVFAARPAKTEQASRALAALNAFSEEAWWDLTRHCGVEDLLKPRGWLKVYQSKQSFDGAAQEREILARRGVRVDVLSPEEIRQLEPNLAPLFHAASFQPDCLALVNPFRAVDSFARTFVERGGEIVQETVTAIESKAETCRVVSDRKSRNSEIVVLAAGAWSKDFARQVGVKPPLETERGYHMMFPTPEKNLTRPVLNCDKSFCMSPMETGLRVTSGEELGGLKAPPNYDRIRRLPPLLKQMLPSLELEEQSVWMGYRPSMPDSLPVIGPSPRDPRVFCAFGHGHYGMTQGPVTGRIIADLVATRDPRADLSGFDPARP
ncbi:MAG: FAD-binding oxidoreductase [Pseudomonadota bacterium]